MATQDKVQSKKDNPKAGLNMKQTIGAFVGIAALLALFFLGVSHSAKPGADLITEGAKPDQSTYEEKASPLDYEKAILKNYDPGILIEMDGKVQKVFAEPIKGSENVLLNIPAGIESEELKNNQIMLTFVEETPALEEHQMAHVYGRYIGTLEYEGPVGKVEVPAIQVDYLSIHS